MNFFLRLANRMARAGDAVLAVLVTGLIAIMFVPVVPWMVDYLVAINIAMSATVFVVAFFLTDAIKLPSMPTILLLSTLYRLTLNVGTTKLILGTAHAGDIIFAFGNLVVGGNFVVGAIVFIVMALIQFIVIAKGAERVAEVAARFNLDAIAPKLMAIDADMRNGLIDEAEAKKRRESTDRESRLFGAMDGALKFVKGDAIAGIIVAIVNIVGGVVIGVFQRKMTPEEALEVYGILTIGDGLVAQIPSLLMSVAAGLCVTRVGGAARDKDIGVASDMVRQFVDNPLGITVTGALMLGLAATSGFTGFPWPPFVTIGVLFLTIGGIRIRTLRGQSAARAETDESKISAARPENERDEKDDKGSFEPRPLALEIHASIKTALELDKPDKWDEFRRRLDEIRREMSKELGFSLPQFAVGIVERSLPQNGYSVLVYDGLVAKGSVEVGKSYALASISAVEAAGIPCGESRLPGSPWKVAVIEPADAARAEAANLRLSPWFDAWSRHLKTILRRNASELLTLQEVSRLADALKESHASVAQAVIPAIFPIQDVAEILRALLRELVPIRDLRRILESLAHIKLPPERRSTMSVVELVRYDLRRAISSHFSVAKMRLDFYTLSPEIESRLRDEAAGRALDPDEREEIRRSVAKAVDPALHVVQPAVILVSADIRFATFLLLEGTLTNVVIMAQTEVSPNIFTQFKKTIALEVEEAAISR